VAGGCNGATANRQTELCRAYGRRVGRGEMEENERGKRRKKKKKKQNRRSARRSSVTNDRCVGRRLIYSAAELVTVTNRARHARFAAL